MPRARREIAAAKAPADLAQRPWDEGLGERLAEETRGVVTRFDPGCFQWVAGGKSCGPAIYFTRYAIRISRDAGALLVAAGEGPLTVEIGLAPRALAVRRAARGWKAAPKDGGWIVSAARLVRELAVAGWETGRSYSAVWDEEHKMLVIKLPSEAKPKRGEAAS